MFRIGIDFDNTIVDYRPVFSSALSGFCGSKTDVRDALRAQPEGEARWQELQAHVYGVAIADAPVFEGFDSFLAAARERNARVFVVSHKTRFAAAAPDGPDLREAARKWLSARAIDVDGVYFEATRREKLARISALELTHFIDDLEDVLRDPAFPPATLPLVFRDSWEAIRRHVFG